MNNLSRQFESVAAEDIAKYIIWYMHNMKPNDLTQVKLHKLIYYVQGMSLAVLDQRAFKSNIEAWKMGPVVNAIYPIFKNGDKPLHPYLGFKPEEIPSILRTIIDTICKTFGRYTAMELVERTHQEDPWKKAYQPNIRNIWIPVESIREFFVDCMNRPKELRFDELCVRYAAGKINILEMADRLEATPEDILVKMDELDVYRSVDVLMNLNLDSTIEKLKFFRERPFVPTSDELHQREVIASQRIEGIDARNHFPE